MSETPTSRGAVLDRLREDDPTIDDLGEWIDSHYRDHRTYTWIARHIEERTGMKPAKQTVINWHDRGDDE